MAQFDLLVIGAGPGGYELAAGAAAQGLSVALVERDRPGGTCLNRGCIPTKCLCHSADVVATVANAAEFGVKVDGFQPDYSDGLAFRFLKSLGRGSHGADFVGSIADNGSHRR